MWNNPLPLFSWITNRRSVYPLSLTFKENRECGVNKQRFTFIQVIRFTSSTQRVITETLKKEYHQQQQQFQSQNGKICVTKHFWKVLFWFAITKDNISEQGNPQDQVTKWEGWIQQYKPSQRPFNEWSVTNRAIARRETVCEWSCTCTLAFFSLIGNTCKREITVLDTGIATREVFVELEIVLDQCKHTNWSRILEGQLSIS